ncbi:hypothetical protein Pcinc_034401 [Petrolisthes cinctipes]|uniref:Uncharacterized protein n=1 Tax=Petrolisthes cinctipes TaxID=88211 RepID=A0AAE1EQB7_PETCI|nr:hypothetical protein Pcinc_034401 [Petrolisthes cinctipes]
MLLLPTLHVPCHPYTCHAILTRAMPTLHVPCHPYTCHAIPTRVILNTCHANPTRSMPSLHVLSLTRADLTSLYGQGEFRHGGDKKSNLRPPPMVYQLIT